MEHYCGTKRQIPATALYRFTNEVSVSMCTGLCGRSNSPFCACVYIFIFLVRPGHCIGPIQCFYFCFISEGNTKKKPTWWDIMHLISSMSEVSRNLPTVHINFALWKLINIFICAHFEPIFICTPSVLLSPSNVTDARNLVLHAA